MWFSHTKIGVIERIWTLSHYVGFRAISRTKMELQLEKEENEVETERTWRVMRT